MVPATDRGEPVIAASLSSLDWWLRSSEPLYKRPHSVAVEGILAQPKA